MKKETCFLFITNQFKIGGVERVFLNIAKLRTEKIFLLPVNQQFDESFVIQIPENVEIIKHSFVFSRKITDCINLNRLINLINKKFSEMKVVVINFSDTISTLILTKKIKSVKKISWIHCNPRAYKQSKFFILYKFIFSRMNKIVCLCEGQKSIFMNLFKVKENKVLICNNYLDGSIIQNLMNEELNFSYPYFVMVARIDFRSKDFYTPLCAFKRFKSIEKSDIKLVLLGDGENRNLVENKVKELGLEEDVILMGNQINPYKWMKISNAVLLSSKSEGYSMVVEEALACGSNVISSDCDSGPREILDNGKYGKLFKVGNEDELVKCYCYFKNKIDNFEINHSRFIELNQNAIDSLDEFFKEFI